MAKILAVDDEPAILEMIESILNKDGHLVTKVSNPLKINMEDERVIIRTKLEKPSKIKGLALI